MIGQEEVLGVGFDVLGATDGVAHWRHQQKDPTPQLDQMLPDLPEAERQHKDEGCRNHDRVQHEQRDGYRRLQAEQDLSEHRGSVLQPVRAKERYCES